VKLVQLSLHQATALQTLQAQEVDAYSAERPLLLDCADLTHLDYATLQALLIYGKRCRLLNDEAIRPMLERYGVSQHLLRQELPCLV
jgi:anti-anti-sigma regulatory factor